MAGPASQSGMQLHNLAPTLTLLPHFRTLIPSHLVDDVGTGAVLDETFANSSNLKNVAQ